MAQLTQPPILQEEIDFYYNEAGLFVFTANYLLKRGFCCHNGCKHCPYPKDETKPHNDKSDKHSKR